LDDATPAVADSLAPLSASAEEILASVSDAFFAIGRDWQFIYVNARAESMLESQPGALLGKTLWESYPGLLGSQFEGLYRQAMTAGVPSSLVDYYPDHDRWYEVDVRPARYGISIYFRDVSASTRAAQNLRRLAEETDRQRRTLDAVLSNTSDHNFVFDLQGRCTYANQALLKTWGRTLEQCAGKTLLELNYSPEVAAPLEQQFRRVIETAEEARGETEYQSAAETRHYEYIYVPVISAEGNVVAIAGSSRDITVRIRNEQALRESERRLLAVNASLAERVEERTTQLLAKEALIRTFYEHSSQCIAVLVETSDGAFRYEEINPATLRLYGKTREQVIGKTIEEVLGVELAPELNRHLRECLRLGKPYHYERSQGEGVVEAVATPAPPEPDAARRLLVSARDVTERRRLEQQLRQAQKMEAVGQLTGGLAHDFNNLLAAISGSLEVLKIRLAQGRISDLDRYVTAAQVAARRSAALTHRLLAFARRQTLDPKHADVNRLVADLEELIRRTVGPEIKVEVVGAAGLWLTLVDTNQLESALLNLCINARDAMPHGGRLTIDTANRWLDERAALERELEPGQYVSICVSDTGSGMSPEVISRAFEPFFTTKPLGQGTGLGLSMVYGFARQSGGQVRIYSEVEQGSMVCIYLPRHHGEPELAEVVHQTADEARAEQGETVLVVDDEPTLRMLMVELLQDLGYTTIEAADGVAGLKVLQSNRRVDLLVTDVGLPGGLNGRQLADAGRAVRAGLKVLFITGYAENAVVGHGHLDPGFHILTKPFPMASLANRIGDILARH
jgi:PAS domain S-box-containing protein